MDNYKGRCTQDFHSTIVSDNYKVRNLAANSLDFAVDIGANVGFFSVFIKMLQASAEVYALEPDPRTYKYLKDNTKNLEITADNSALGDGSKVALTKDYGNCNTGNIFTPTDYGDIDSITLPQLFNKYDRSIDERYLLKIDCEGGERFLIGDAESEEIICRSVRTVMEVHFPNVTKDNQFLHCPTYEEYAGWINSTFANTHSIEYYASSKYRGIGHYNLVRRQK